MSQVAELGQYMTPMWVAQALVEKFLPHLGRNDLVIEPTCGRGAFLRALPDYVPAVGVEVDPVLADEARKTGREVITGDFRTVPLNIEPTCFLGNPPFKTGIYDAILDRAHAMLPEGALAGFILPVYFLQTSSHVQSYQDKWSLKVELLPRNIFNKGLSKPLAFCLFRKDRHRALVGFALYDEVNSVETMHKHYRELLGRVSKSAWGTAVAEALINLGGEADLDSIYRAMEPKRPTGNQFWKEQVRKVLQASFRRAGSGRWSVPQDLAMAA